MPKKCDHIFRSNLMTPANLMECVHCGEEADLSDLEKPRKRGDTYTLKEKPKGSDK